MLAAFGALRCLRHAADIAAAKPIGPFNAFCNEDHWTDEPTRPGVVLIGDAAGFNDPVAGQGLSIAFRDVRMLRDAVAAKTGFAHLDFAPYATERAERMRRLRVAAHLIACASSSARRRERAGPARCAARSSRAGRRHCRRR